MRVSASRGVSASHDLVFAPGLREAAESVASPGINRPSDRPRSRIAGHGDRRRPGRLRLGLTVWWRGAELDRRLAAGEDPWGERCTGPARAPDHRPRASRAPSPTAWPACCAVPRRRPGSARRWHRIAPEVLGQAAVIAAIERRLRAPEPVAAHGVAMLRLLLIDGNGPLYRPSEPGALGSRLRAAAAALRRAGDGRLRAGMSESRRRQSLHEAAHKLDRRTRRVADRVRRSFNEAAHKLGHWPARRPVAVREQPARAAARPRTSATSSHTPARAVLALGALGVVYGDIGTSPLYTEQVIFTPHRAAAKTTLAGVYGVVSLIFWALMIVVTIKYAGFIMRAHNRGDGGIMALTALIQRRKVMRTAVLVTLGIFGASLFFGDGMITPAISVLSAVEGLKVAAPGVRPPGACRSRWPSWSACSPFSAMAPGPSAGYSAR